MFYRVIPAAADAALGSDAHAAAAANKSKAGGRGSFAAKFAKIHEKVRQPKRRAAQQWLMLHISRMRASIQLYYGGRF